MRRLPVAPLAGALLLTVAPSRTAGAQPSSPTGRAAIAEYQTGGELESYLRSLQALGIVPVQPWSVRGFSPVEIDRLSPPDSAPAAHPWMRRFELAPPAGEGAGVRTWLVAPRLETRYNSTFAFGSNDGATWAGRGLTATASGGAGLRWGPLTAVLAPTAFWTQNGAFPLLDNGLPGEDAFRDPLRPREVDRPQRFGDRAFGSVDLGASTVRLDAFGASLGVSTGHEWWGPAQRFPFLLGTNAAGFPHAFVGTARPANLWLVRLHGRVIWGRLDQSDYFTPEDPITRPRRFATGLLVTLQPRGLENLELGAARFIHAPWPDEGMPGRYLLRAFEGLLKRTLSPVDNPIPGDDRSQDGENQLASVFARLVIPGTGFEVYTEFGREDHSWDARELLVLPDHLPSLTVGFRKSWARSGQRMTVLRAESINFESPSSGRFRGSDAIYVHSSGSNQGHTQRGQLLGADVAVGSGAGAFVAVDLLDESGRWTAEWQRIVRQEAAGLGPGGTASEQARDVVHSLGLERLLFSRRADVAAGLTWSYNLNRNFARDRQNLSLTLSMTGLPR